MSSGYRFDPDIGRLVFTYGGEEIFATSGNRLVSLLTDLHEFDNQALVFDDLQKDIYYHFTYDLAYDGFSDTYAGTSSSRCFISAVPQEKTTSTVLMAAPDGTDIFLGMVKISRTSGPSHTWWNDTLTALPSVCGEWLLWDGSAPVEANIGFGRLIHVRVNESNNLVLEGQQSVCVEAGGYGWYGNHPPSLHSHSNGHHESYGTTPGLPFYYDPSNDRSSSLGYNNTGALLGFSGWNRNDIGQSNASPTTDPTNMGSTYSVSIRGKFGRRS